MIILFYTIPNYQAITNIYYQIIILYYILLSYYIIVILYIHNYIWVANPFQFCLHKETVKQMKIENKNMKKNTKHKQKIYLSLLKSMNQFPEDITGICRRSFFIELFKLFFRFIMSIWSRLYNFT